MACFQTTTLLVLALAVIGVFSAPALLEKRTFTVHGRSTGPVRQRNGFADLARAYRKHGLTVPHAMDAAAIKANARIKSDQEGETEAEPQEGDASFLCEIEVGGQKITVNFDTGSSDLWVYSNKLPASQTAGHSVFDPSKSSTFQPMEDGSWSIVYGDGSNASGIVGFDEVSVGNAKVPSQAVELATRISDQFAADTETDGLMGLGFSNGNTVKLQDGKSVEQKPQNTFFGNIASSLKKPVFTAQLQHHTPGSYQFGEVDTTQFTGTMKMFRVDPSRGYWEFESSRFAIGDNEVQSNKRATPAIADTGTSLLLVDDSTVNAYYGNIAGRKFDEESRYWSIPCDAELPDLKLALGPEYMATVPGPLLNYAPNGPSKENMCLGGLQSQLDSPVQILGIILFKAQFAVFDNRGPSIGFAPHA